MPFDKDYFDRFLCAGFLYVSVVTNEDVFFGNGRARPLLQPGGAAAFAIAGALRLS